jgi:hypothetical protein
VLVEHAVAPRYAAADTTVQAASVKLDISPRSGAVYQATEPHTHYTYFKPRNRG